MREHHAVDGVDQVLGLQIGKLLLLRAEFHVEQVVVELGDDGLQRHAALDTGGCDHGRADVARIDEAGGGGIGDRRLLEVARRMAGGRDLLDALAEEVAAAHDVEDLGLIQGNFNRAGSDVVGGGVNVEEIGGHSFLS